MAIKGRERDDHHLGKGALSLNLEGSRQVAEAQHPYSLGSAIHYFIYCLLRSRHPRPRCSAGHSIGAVIWFGRGNGGCRFFRGIIFQKKNFHAGRRKKKETEDGGVGSNVDCYFASIVISA